MTNPTEANNTAEQIKMGLAQKADRNLEILATQSKLTNQLLGRVINLLKDGAKDNSKPGIQAVPTDDYTNVIENIVKILTNLLKGDVRDLGFAIHPNHDSERVIACIENRIEVARAKIPGFCEEFIITALEPVDDGVIPVHIKVRK